MEAVALVSVSSVSTPRANLLPSSTILLCPHPCQRPLLNCLTSLSSASGMPPASAAKQSLTSDMGLVRRGDMREAFFSTRESAPWAAQAVRAL
eukprot:1878996-Lingulodinium_polyedra.AAC.1